jgi:hypothetical protein
MVKDRWVQSVGESNDLNGLIDTRKDIYHPNLCQCTNHLVTKDKQWFNTFYKHQTAFEFYDNNIQKDVRRRQRYNSSNS